MKHIKKSHFISKVKKIQTVWLIVTFVITIVILYGFTPTYGASDYTLALSPNHPLAPTAIIPHVVSSFAAPGGQVSGLAWGNNSLWLVDENDNIYQLDANGTVQATFASPVSYVVDLAWHENSLWLYDDDPHGSKVHQLNASGQIISTLDINHSWASGMEWVEGYLYLSSRSNNNIDKYDSAGNHISSWETTFFGKPEDMTFDGTGLWIADSCFGLDTGLWRYSLQGVFQDKIDIDSVEPCDDTSNRAMAWDGQYLWYAGKFTVYRIDITGPFVNANVGMAGVSDSNATWGDYDGDGDLDAAVIGLVNTNPSSNIYRNNGDGTFTDIAAAIADVYDGSVAWGDYDNDGDLDILLTGCAAASCSVRTTRIYRNLGSGTFANVTGIGLPGIAGGDAEWGDYDNDGDLDILLVGHNGSGGINRIYRHDQNGAFTAIPLAEHEYAGIAWQLYNGSVAWGDYDNDGDLDALLAGCYTATCFKTSMDIYRNDGDDIFALAFMGAGARNSSVAWGDYDNDGDLDILLAGSVGFAASETCTTIIYENDNGTAFTDIGALLAGVCHASAVWGDYDNDGKLDIAIVGATSKIYHNDGHGEFSDIGASLKDVDDGSVTWGDYDNDSDLDLLLTGSDFALVYSNGSTATNSAPSAPNGLQTSCSSHSCTLMWNASADDHTPSSGLTYNVRVGTTPGSGDVVSPMAITNPDALNSGYRFVSQMGNAGEMLTFHLRGLNPETTYYWSVQAIDSAYAGSPFAVEANADVPKLAYLYLPVVLKVN